MRILPVLAAFVVIIAAPAPAAAHEKSTTSVVHTGRGPTGYEARFRIYDPMATRLRIKGEWYFANGSDRAGKLPDSWQRGDFPLAEPNSTAANWPVADLVKNPRTGLWEYTTPLPSGVFTYALYRDCDAEAPALAGCTPTADPGNPPWNPRELSSQVYVPSDRRFGTVDYSWQAPASPRHRGEVAAVTYPSPLSTSPVGSHDLVVYTPPGYDAHRRTPYPLLVLNHGGGGNEADWTTQGAMASIVDDLIRSGRIQPLVIVNTNAGGISGGNAGYASDVLNAVIPYATSHYNVARSAPGWAYAGLSAGGSRGNELLFNNTTALGYVGIWSCCNNGSIRPPGDPIYDNPGLKTLLGLHLAVGNQDPVRPAAEIEMAGLTAAGVPHREFLADGGHEWFFWRLALRDYLTTVAFRATTTTVTVRRGSLIASVIAATGEPATPTGKVQFTLNGRDYGPPRSLHAGVATTAAPRGAGVVGARYLGDRYYSAS